MEYNIYIMVKVINSNCSKKRQQQINENRNIYTIAITKKKGGTSLY